VAHPQIAAFARMADGNDMPLRKIEGQKTLLGRTMHTIVYDPKNDEISVPQDFAHAIMTYRGDADGEATPLRILQGPKTLLNGPERHAVDWVNDETYVPQGNEILVFNRRDNGNVAPKRIFKGPDTKLGADAMAVDTLNNLLVVVGPYEAEGLKIRMYPRTATGNVKPLRQVGGPKSMIKRLGGPFALHQPKGWIVMTMRPAEAGVLGGDDSFTGIWSVFDDGDVPPRWTIGGPRGALIMPRGVAIDEKNKNIIVTDKRLNAILTYHFPEIF
jgi:hypothetical protein